MKGPIKFRRTARIILDQFDTESQLDLPKAIETLKERLKNERNITQRYVWAKIKKQYGFVLHD